MGHKPDFADEIAEEHANRTIITLQWQFEAGLLYEPLKSCLFLGQPADDQMYHQQTFQIFYLMLYGYSYFHQFINKNTYAS